MVAAEQHSAQAHSVQRGNRVLAAGLERIAKGQRGDHVWRGLRRQPASSGYGRLARLCGGVLHKLLGSTPSSCIQRVLPRRSPARDVAGHAPASPLGHGEGLGGDDGKSPQRRPALLRPAGARCRVAAPAATLKAASLFGPARGQRLQLRVALGQRAGFCRRRRRAPWVHIRRRPGRESGCRAVPAQATMMAAGVAEPQRAGQAMTSTDTACTTAAQSPRARPQPSQASAPR